MAIINITHYLGMGIIVLILSFTIGKGRVGDRGLRPVKEWY